MSNDRSSILLPLLAGVAAGAALGVLLAPRSGAETRAALRRKAEEAYEGVEGLVDEVRERVAQAKEGVAGARGEANDLVGFLVAEGRDLWERIQDERKRSA